MLRAAHHKLHQVIAGGSSHQEVNCSNCSTIEMIESAGIKLGSSYLSLKQETADEQKVQQPSAQLGKPAITVERVHIEQWR